MSKLYIVPTPIGNLQDITLRALDTLKFVDLILAEDTRHSKKLLDHFDIRRKLQSHHEHNEHKTLSGIINKLKDSQKIALVTDAGTPGISDPGYLLIRECIKENIEVECLPGPTAIIPALVQSGIPCNEFYFAGFLPHKKGRQKKLLELQQMNKTLIFYESPHRLLKTLEQLIEYFSEDRNAAVVRELTKIHEENVRGPLKDIFEHFKSKPIKGEIVIIVEEEK